MRIDTNISDLFFNTDVSGAKRRDAAGNFVGWDDDKLREEGALFLGCLDRLGVGAPPLEDLIADFYNRL